MLVPCSHGLNGNVVVAAVARSVDAGVVILAVAVELAAEAGIVEGT